MSATDGNLDCGRVLDAAPYVLGALEDGDSYREHLEECATCRAEVAQLQPAVDTLPTSVPQVAAPEALRARVLTTVRSEAELLRAAGSGVDQRPRRNARWRMPRVSLAGAGAALAAAVAASVAIAVSLNVTSHERVTVAQVHNLPGTSAALHQVGDRAELVVSGMPEPPLGKVYEVWLRRGSTTVAPTDALFSVTSRGSGSVAVPGNLHGVREVLVTSEPLGGSSHPTSNPVLRVALST